MMIGRLHETTPTFRVDSWTPSRLFTILYIVSRLHGPTTTIDTTQIIEICWNLRLPMKLLVDSDSEAGRARRILREHHVVHGGTLPGGLWLCGWRMFRVGESGMHSDGGGECVCGPSVGQGQAAAVRTIRLRRNSSTEKSSWW